LGDDEGVGELISDNFVKEATLNVGRNTLSSCLEDDDTDVTDVFEKFFKKVVEAKLSGVKIERDYFLYLEGFGTIIRLNTQEARGVVGEIFNLIEVGVRFNLICHPLYPLEEGRPCCHRRQLTDR